MRIIKVTSILFCCMFFMTGCMEPTATGINEDTIEFVQLNEMKVGQEIAVIETSKGTIKMALFPKEAPKTVAQFKKLIEQGFYNDKEIFIKPDFKAFITGATDEIGTKGKIATDDGKPLECEVTPNLWHFSGAVSALGYEKNKFSKTLLSDSRFFIVGDVGATTDMVTQMEEYKYPQKVINAYKEHGGLPQYTGAYTVFGQVYEGLDIVNEIFSLSVKEGSVLPEDGTKIIKIELSKYEKPIQK
ncbi:MAG: peptidylprolyl isomerase [Oscillospiraceae bacterium]